MFYKLCLLLFMLLLMGAELLVCPAVTLSQNDETCFLESSRV